MADGEQTAQTARNTQADGVQDAAGNQGEASEAQTPQFEPLTVTYERLRHSTDPQELHEFARRPLPDRAKQAAFSRATALLEAVAGKSAHAVGRPRVPRGDDAVPECARQAV